MKSFFTDPILNSPYEPPRWHHPLDDESGQPLSAPPIAGRRKSKFISPVPQPKKKGKPKPGSLFPDALGQTTPEQEYNPSPIIDEIRSHLESWRRLPNPTDWGVTPTTARLLTHWRTHKFSSVTPFFCQIEAAETIIWLTEVASHAPRYKRIWDHIRNANKEANPDLVRLAMKMATGAGKTTVMAMLIAWQTVNAVRAPGGKTFAKGFLIVTPGITIKDRLRVLLPEHPESYYRNREILPAEMLGDIAKARIVITNYHAFKLREKTEITKAARSLLRGRGAPVVTIETESMMLTRVCEPLLSLDNVVVLNDEAHHCYHEKVTKTAEAKLEAEQREEAKQNGETARLWISGVEALKRRVPRTIVYDLSATPFFLAGSGYLHNALFPWVVSDFSLMDAIESGIVKLPRIPIDDNLASGDMPLYRDLWRALKDRGLNLPRKGAGKSGELDPHTLFNEIQTALYSLYSHYEKVFAEWDGIIATPPVFIVVCSNTAVSKLVYEWISGWQRLNPDDEPYTVHKGHLKLFRNFDDHGQRLPRPNTLLIDSTQLESDDALDPQFREMAGPEIEQFKYELKRQHGAGGDAEDISDSALLREVMNTVGKPGKLGADIRCVVSVSMLTEGWDANTVTHIFGLRAFGTQLLCEQVVGRALRRQSYELRQESGMFDVEYADIMGIPFDFTSAPVVAPPKPPKPVTQVKALRERASLEITFPRVEGYRVDFPPERLKATFGPDSYFTINPENVGPCTVLMQGIVGESVEITPAVLEEIRPSTISYHIARRLLQRHYLDADGDITGNLFYDAAAIARRWIHEGYLIAEGVPKAAITYQLLADQAAERIHLACQRAIQGERRTKAILDPYNRDGSSRFVNFTTSKPVHTTDAAKSHVNAVVIDSGWEGEAARCIERNPHVISYVKNHGLGFEIPYRDGSIPRKYLPDFIVRIDTGAEPLNLILEVKGFRDAADQVKAETTRTQWVEGVNNLGTHGRWDFAEFREPFLMQKEFDALVESKLDKVTA